MPDPLTAAELHARYGIHRQTVDHWRRIGKITPVSGQRQNNRNPWHYDPDEIERLLNPHLAALRARLERAQIRDHQ